MKTIFFHIFIAIAVANNNFNNGDVLINDLNITHTIIPSPKLVQESTKQIIIGLKPGFDAKDVLSTGFVLRGRQSFKPRTLFKSSKYTDGQVVIVDNMAESTIANLEKDERVSYVSNNAIVTQTKIQRVKNIWHLDRIDQYMPTLDGKFNHDTKAGKGTLIYVLDTGILHNHSDLKRRVLPGYDCFKKQNGYTNVPGAMSHGTIVASVAVGRKYGVAKGAKVVTVRIFDSDENTSVGKILEGIEWILEHAAKYNVRRGIVNMSLGGPKNDALDAGVLKLFRNGLIPVVAAGNSFGDACLSSPAKLKEAVTVGGTTTQLYGAGNKDFKYAYSNYGKCVDLFAPAQGIVGASSESTSKWQVQSGTSLSSPMVAAVLATIWSNQPNLNHKQVIDTLLTQYTTKNMIRGLDYESSPNKLVSLDARRSQPLTANLQSPQLFVGNKKINFAESFLSANNAILETEEGFRGKTVVVYKHHGCKKVSKSLFKGGDKIAIVDSYDCPYHQKALLAQAAGAIGVIFVSRSNLFYSVSPMKDLPPTSIPSLMVPYAEQRWLLESEGAEFELIYRN